MQWKCSSTHVQRVENALQWKSASTLFSLSLLFPNRVTYGGWVPRNLKAGAAASKPESTPKACNTCNSAMSPAYPAESA